jgi:hypothetical protein
MSPRKQAGAVPIVSVSAMAVDRYPRNLYTTAQFISRIVSTNSFLDRQMARTVNLLLFIERTDSEVTIPPTFKEASWPCRSGRNVVA